MRKPDELLPILDEQIALLQHRLALMQGMADCVGRADLGRLEELLRGEGALEAQGDELDGRLEELRRGLAEAAGMPPGQMTLGRLVESLEGPLAIALSDRRERLLLLVESVHAASLRTAALVRHALEFNQRMIGVLLGAAGEGSVYAADGEVRPEATKTVVRHCV
jgi:hypothetical protein